jgi:undecaprenyl-diphosphatase
LMAIPIITLASLLKIKQLVEQAEPVQWDVIVLGIVVSGVAAYLCIRVFLQLLEKLSMLPFAIYRVLLAIVIAIAFAAV